MLTDVVMPQMGESVAEGTITKWYKKVGDHVERDEVLFEITTDKVDAEIPSPVAGRLVEILVKENETVPVNTAVAAIETEVGASTGAPSERAAMPAAASPSQAAPLAAETPPPEEVLPPGSTMPAETSRPSPLVRRMAREHNVDLSQIQGTGQGGRVSKRDILAYLAERARSPVPPSVAATPPATAEMPVAPPLGVAPIVFSGPTHTVPMTPIRKQIAEHMLLSRRTSAHVTTVFEVEMTRVVETRELHEAAFERRQGFKLTYTPFFVRVATEAIRHFPIINATVEGTNIVYKRDINIGIAVALETGLIVPVIKQAQEKDFTAIARAVQDLAERARNKRLSVDDVHGGTFTITNPGAFGSLFGTPIINQPQVAILDVGVIEKRPVVRHDAIAIRPMVYLALSFDHRVIDGAVADQFMARIKSLLENWSEPVV